MKSEKLKSLISKLPETPGIYKFTKDGKVLYVGKATSLRDRVRSYFNTNITETRGPLISKMLGEFDDIKFIKTGSVLEALILEANLIKKYQPEANTKEKDNKSFNYVVITDEDFPKVLTVRKREIEKNSKHYDISYKFGPFPNGSQLKEAMKIVRKMFPFRDKCDPPHPPTPSPKGKGKENNTQYFSKAPSLGEGVGGGLSCFNRQIGLCPGVCTGEISKKDYQKIIKNIVLFFESNKKKLIKNLEKQMKEFARIREFEKAQKVKKTIFTLNHIQDIALIKDQVSKMPFDTTFRIESYDIAHLSGTNMVGAMVVVEDGELKKSDYRKFLIKGNTGADDTKALSEVIARRLAHSEWLLPNLIVVDGGIAQKRVAEKILKENKLKIPVVSVVKDERHKPRKILGMNNELRIMNYGEKEKNILLSNAEAHRFALSFHKQIRGKILK